MRACETAVGNLNSPETTRFAVADKSAVYAVTHAAVKTRSISTGAVHLAMLAVETRSTLANVIRVGDVTTVAVVLARSRRTRVVASTVAVEVSVVAIAVIVCRTRRRNN